MKKIPAIVKKEIYVSDGYAVLSASLNKDSDSYCDSIISFFKEKNIFEKNTKTKTKPKPKNYSLDNLQAKNEDLVFTIVTNLWDKKENSCGQQYIFVGSIVNDPKYGNQFKADVLYKDISKNINEKSLKEFLKTLPFIKDARSDLIIKKFGVKKTIDVLDKNPEELLKIKGIGITKANVDIISSTWEKSRYLMHLYEWLINNNISPSYSKKIFEKWGINSISTLENNPYALTEIKGFGFLTADEIAFKIFKEVNKELRLVACIRHVLFENMYKNGHLTFPFSMLIENVISLLKECNNANNIKENIKDYLIIIKDVIKSNLNIFNVYRNTEDNTVYVGFKSSFDKEKFISNFLFDMYNHTVNSPNNICTDEELNLATKDISNIYNKNVVLDKTQIMAIKSAFEKNISIITGGGGTGKSTICRCIVYIAKLKKMSVKLMTPTGKSAQVLSKKTQYPAGTIHRSLKMKPPDLQPNGLIKEDILIIDESSMIGMDEMYSILLAVSNPNLKIIFVGDQNQLPSVSPGNFLYDFINSNCFSVVFLDRIHRQREGSYISYVANLISSGKKINIPNEADDIFIKNINQNNIKQEIYNFIEEYLENGNDINDLQFISPIKKGNLGVESLNKIVQNFMCNYNNQEKSLQINKFTSYHVGDRVMQIVNNYDRLIFNGDIGVVKEIGRKIIENFEADYMLVSFENSQHIYYNKYFNEIMLAWACTVHKYQGSQADTVCFFLPKETYSLLLNKELTYTGITRAENKLIIFSDIDTLNKASSQSAIKKRYTNTCFFLKELAENTKILHDLTVNYIPCEA